DNKTEYFCPRLASGVSIQLLLYVCVVGGAKSCAPFRGGIGGVRVFDCAGDGEDWVCEFCASGGDDGAWGAGGGAVFGGDTGGGALTFGGALGVCSGSFGGEEEFLLCFV
ncbi:MAG TPA: hypothetical protein PK530_18040, partial [Anaerolineales bacterium]|nr:hypothetical protein [Anaerolineales bacterium]